jgi:RHS repeat-associated protein
VTAVSGETRNTPAAASNDIVVDMQDRLLEYGQWTYEYLADGRLKERWERITTTQYQLTCYDYDLFGALRRVDIGDPSGSTVGDPCTGMTMQSSIDYDIDPVGRRIGRREVVYAGSPVEETVVDRRRWVYRDGLNPVAQLDAAGRLTQVYVYATRQHTPDYMIGLTWPADPTATTPTGTTLYRLVSDVRGSVRLVVDATTGTVAQQLTYDPYGQVLDDTAPGFQPFGYAGGEYDWTTGLTRFGARDYDATIGRWTAKDPIGFAGGDTNLYAYVGGEPVNWVDITGLQQVRECWAPLQNGLGNVPFHHVWIEVDDTAAGFQPGFRFDYDEHNGVTADGTGRVPLSATRPGAVCHAHRNVLNECVTNAIQNHWFPYIPGIYDCRSAARTILAACGATQFPNRPSLQDAISPFRGFLGTLGVF